MPDVDEFECNILRVNESAFVGGNLTVEGKVLTPGLLPAMTQEVFVSKGGNNLTGDGTEGNPFLTIAHALSTITDASTSKRYAVIVGPGSYADSFQIKPWTAIVGVTVGNDGATPNGFAQTEISAPSDTCGLDASFATSGFSVGWYAYLGFTNHQTWAEPVGSQPQLIFQSCSFDFGATYTGPGTTGTDNVAWNDCLSYGGATVTGWQFFWCRNCTFLGGTVAIHAGPPGALESTTFLAQGCSIGASLSPTNVNIQWAAPSPVTSLAKGDLSTSAIVGALTLDGAHTAFSATEEGIPPSVTLLNAAPAPVLASSANGLAYTPAVLANWSGVAPTSVANALDRIAAKITPIP